MNFDQILLEPEQKELFIQIVEIMKQVPREDRGWMIEANSKDGTCLIMPRINSKQNNITGFAYGDLDMIAEAGLMKGEVTDSGGNRYVLKPMAYKYYDWLNINEGSDVNDVKLDIDQISIEEYGVDTRHVLERVNELKKEIDRTSKFDEEQIENFYKKVRLEWNYHSNKLEGNELTYGETRELLYFDKTSGKSHKDHREIKGHDEAISYIEDLIENNEDLTEKVIRELNLKVLKEPYFKEAITQDGNPTHKEIKPGEYKSTPNHVKTKTGDIFKFAEPSEVPQKMEELINWYRTSDDLHPLIKAVQLHYRFVNIHPFDDGNGRVARLLMNYSLMRDDFPPTVVESGQKDEYHSVLRKADAGEFGPLFSFVGESLIGSLNTYKAAMNGDKISEYSDLDKRLKVFKMTLMQDELDEIKEKKTIELIHTRFQDSVWKLFEAFGRKMEEFYDLFAETELKFIVNDTTYSDYLTLNQINKKFTEEHLNDENLRKLGIEFVLLGFKKSGFSPLNTHVKVVAEFDNYLYNVNTGNRNNQGLPSIRKLYHQKISESEIEDFIYRIGTNLLDQVEAHYQNQNNNQ